jgi:hypothetical protein
MKFLSVWNFHLYEIFICMTFSSVWVSHMNFAYKFCVWVFICEFLSVNFHLWIFICEFLSVSFHVCEVCKRSMQTKYTNEAFFDETMIIRIFFCNAKLVYIIIQLRVMSFSSFMSSLFSHRCRRFSLKRQNSQSVRTFHKNKLVHIIWWEEYLLNMHVKRRAFRVESFVESNFFYSRRRSRARFDENGWTFKAYNCVEFLLTDERM